MPWLGIEPGPFGSQTHAQSTELHQPGFDLTLKMGKHGVGIESDIELWNLKNVYKTKQIAAILLLSNSYINML